jgi:hypothetical protein
LNLDNKRINIIRPLLFRLSKQDIVKTKQMIEEKESTDTAIDSTAQAATQGEGRNAAVLNLE